MTAASMRGRSTRWQRGGCSSRGAEPDAQLGAVSGSRPARAPAGRGEVGTGAPAAAPAWPRPNWPRAASRRLGRSVASGVAAFSSSNGRGGRRCRPVSSASTRTVRVSFPGASLPRSRSPVTARPSASVASGCPEHVLATDEVLHLLGGEAGAHAEVGWLREGWSWRSSAPGWWAARLRRSSCTKARRPTIANTPASSAVVSLGGMGEDASGAAGGISSRRPGSAQVRAR